MARYFAGSWVSLELRSAALAPSWDAGAGSRGAPRLAIAGATVRNGHGWSASLFVSRVTGGALAFDERVQLPESTTLNARLTQRLSRSTSLTLDVFNLLDRRVGAVDDFVASRLWSEDGMPRDFLVHPGEPRGVRLAFRKTFR